MITRLLSLAERLIPTVGARLGAGKVQDADVYVQQVLVARPDLLQTLESDLDACTDNLISQILAGDQFVSEEFERVALIVVGSYYMNPVVRSTINYQGQVPLGFDPMEYVSWIEEGLLDQVISRGKRYREHSL